MTGAHGFDVPDTDVQPDGAGRAVYSRAEAGGPVNGWTRVIYRPSGDCACTTRE